MTRSDVRGHHQQDPPGKTPDAGSSGNGGPAALVEGEPRKPEHPVPGRPVDGVPWARPIPNGVFAAVVEAGGLAQLATRVLVDAVRRPVGYWSAVRDEMYSVLKLAWFPLILAVFTFGMMINILGLNFTALLGAQNRYGQYFFVTNIREFTPWINSMVVAGIIGAAICADLGSRKVREELDAFVVLGIDPVRRLVLPRVVSTTIMTPLLMLVSTVIGLITALIGSVTYGGVSAGAYWATTFDNVTTPELLFAMLKSTLIGFVIGVVCSYKGMNAGGGSTGVGRAVNQAVVIAFALVFLVDLACNMIYLGLFPEANTVR